MPVAERIQPLDLKEQLGHILEESRMVLPGIQALFGFQMIVVFEQTFARLPQIDKEIHIGAVALTALAIGLAMAPAAFHRRMEPDCVSERLVRLSTRFLSWAMLPLAIGLSLDFYLVCHVALGVSRTAAALGSSVLAFLAILWFIWPSMHHRRGTDE